MDVREQYLKNQIAGAPPEKLLMLLLEGGERFIRKALQEIEKKNIDATHLNIVKAQNVYLELFCALEQDAGDFVPHLQGLYYLMYDKLLDANVKKQSEPLQECLQIAEQLTSMWREVIDKYHTEKLAGHAAATELAGLDIRG